MEKKWPVLAQIIIGLGCISGIMGTIAALAMANFFMLVIGVGTFYIFWAFYKFKPWAHQGVSILLTAIIIFDIFSTSMNKVPPAYGLAGVAFRGLILYYLHTPRIKGMFEIPAN
jgi:hypothetical protein